MTVATLIAFAAEEEVHHNVAMETIGFGIERSLIVGRQQSIEDLIDGVERGQRFGLSRR